MASEAAEAGLIPHMTRPTMSRGRMQSLKLLSPSFKTVDLYRVHPQVQTTCGLEKYIPI